jgi:hypothetical protein
MPDQTKKIESKIEVNYEKKSSFKKTVILMLIFVAVAVVTYQSRQSIYAEMDKLKLIPRPERFTELYFDDHTNLPTRISKNEDVSFTFVIHNLEGKEMEYPYVVYFQSKDGNVVKIAEGFETLADGEYKAIEKTYVSNSDQNEGGVFVRLKELDQSIHFLLNINQ